MWQKGRLVKGIFVFLIFLILLGCGKSSDVTVTFNSNGGTEVAKVILDESRGIPIPDEPTKDGYTFAGWFSDENLTVNSNFKSIPTESVTFYAKWDLIESSPDIFNITYVLNGGINSINPKTFSDGTNSLSLNEPVKEGSTFNGWYLDAAFEIIFNSQVLPESNIVLYAKWTEDIVNNNSLINQTLPIHSSSYGNTNGNLHNDGLAVYDKNLELHYYSSGNSVYSYSPSEDITTLVFSLSTGGRATFLNLDDDLLFYIDSSNGYLVSYDTVNHIFTSVSETENSYASITQGWVNFIHPVEQYGSTYNALQRYDIEDKTFSSYTNGIEFMNIYGTRVYYKPVDQVQLSMMSYNGMGKTSIAHLYEMDVEIIHEMLLLDVDSNYVPYYALILTVDGRLGIYFYDSNNGLVKILGSTESTLNSLNFDGTFVYFITGSELWKINITLTEIEKVLDLPESNTDIQIINYWIYFGSYELNNLYRINPDTNEIELLD